MLPSTVQDTILLYSHTHSPAKFKLILLLLNVISCLCNAGNAVSTPLCATGDVVTRRTVLSCTEYAPLKSDQMDQLNVSRCGNYAQ